MLEIRNYAGSEEADDWHAVEDQELQLVVAVTEAVTVAQALRLAACPVSKCFAIKKMALLHTAQLFLFLL